MQEQKGKTLKNQTELVRLTLDRNSAYQAELGHIELGKVNSESHDETFLRGVIDRFCTPSFEYSVFKKDKSDSNSQPTNYSIYNISNQNIKRIKDNSEIIIQKLNWRAEIRNEG